MDYYVRSLKQNVSFAIWRSLVKDKKYNFW